MKILFLLASISISKVWVEKPFAEPNSQNLKKNVRVSDLNSKWAFAKLITDNAII